MATGKITKRTVDAMPATPKQQMLWDEELSGFGLKVSPAGNKVYLVQYRMGGRGSPTRRYTIGNHGNPWTPAAARTEAERVLEMVRKGVDPAEEKVERKRVAADLAFASYARLFLEEEVKLKWKASYADGEGILRLHVLPVLKNKPLPSIRKADISALIGRIDPARVALRRNTYAVVRRLFRWAVGRGDLERSPLEGFEAPAAATARDRVLKDWELRLAWLASGELGYPFGPLYRGLILTGQRREEVSGLDWRELHRETAEWNLPAVRAKNGVASVIHLSLPMIAELDAVAEGEKWSKRGLVFTTTGKTPVSGYSKGKARLDREILALGRKEAEAANEDPEQFEMEPWRVHDLRRTFATGMQRLGVRFEVTEAVLNHLSGSKSGVAGVYQRHDWKQEKIDALNAWAAHVERVVRGTEETNVVQLAQRA